LHFIKEFIRATYKTVAFVAFMAMAYTRAHTSSLRFAKDNTYGFVSSFVSWRGKKIRHILPLSRHIPIRTFALRAYSRLFVNVLRNPLMPTPFTTESFKFNVNQLSCQCSPPDVVVYNHIIYFYNNIVKGY